MEVDKTISAAGAILNNPRQPLKGRFRALFTLRNLGGEQSILEISRCFSDDSDLLKHELAYCLGQMRDPGAVPILTKVLTDTAECSMVRHEAGEALGAIGAAESLPLLDRLSGDSLPEVAETCGLAARRVRWLLDDRAATADTLSNNPYQSIDPAPPLPHGANGEAEVDRWAAILTDRDKPLWQRYRAMFALRNVATTGAALALTDGLACEDSALFRHEVAFVLGQLRDAASAPALGARLALGAEHSMVRHECAEALGAIATSECREILEQFLHDNDRVVRESCEVALDISDYENSVDFQYCTAGAS